MLIENDLLSYGLVFCAQLNGIFVSRIGYLESLNEQLRRHCTNFTALSKERCRVTESTSQGESLHTDEASQDMSSVAAKEPGPLFNALDSLDAILAKAKVIRNASYAPSAPHERQQAATAPAATSKAKSSKSSNSTISHTLATKAVAAKGRKGNSTTTTNTRDISSSKDKSGLQGEPLDDLSFALEEPSIAWTVKLKSKYELLKRRNFASKIFVGLLHRIGKSYRSIPFYGNRKKIHL
jgi:hypothetical protein